MNIFGVRLVAIVNNTGVLFEILGMVVFAFVVALFHHHQGAGVIFHTGGTTLTTGTFLVAMFMSLYVIYGFDTASTLAEETKNPRMEAPKAVIASVIGAFVIGGIFLYAMLLGIPDMKSAIKEGWGPAQIIDANFGERLLDGVPAGRRSSDLRLLPRDPDLDDPPLLRHGARRRASRLEVPRARCNPRLHTPVWSCIVVGILAGIPYIQFAGVFDHRDRRDRDDLPELPDREPRAAPREASRLAADEGAVLARPLGPPDHRARDRLGRRHADQHALAARRDEPAAQGAAGHAELPLALAERPARALDRARRDPDRRRAVLRPRPADEARAPAGAGGRDPDAPAVPTTE